MMAFVLTFIFGGVLCAIFQFLLMHTKLDMIKLLGGAFVLGSLLYAVGILPVMENLSKGIVVTLTSAGGMFCNAVILGAKGNIAACLGMLFSFFAVMALVLLLGIIAAVVHMKFHPQTSSEENQKQIILCNSCDTE